jgi:hypothetical protein
MRSKGMGSSIKRTLVIGIIVFATIVFCLEGQEKILAVKGGQIHTITGGVVENGVILISGGIIQDIGKDVEIPSDAEVLDYTGKFIMPGVVSPHSYLGIPPPSAAEQREAMRSGPVIKNLADYPVRYSIYPEDPVFHLALKNGVTTLAISPRPGGIAGLGAVIQPGGDSLNDILVREKAFLKVNVYINTVFWDTLKRALDGAQKKLDEEKKKAEERKEAKNKDKKKSEETDKAEEKEEEEIKESTQIFMDVIQGKLSLVADCYSPAALSHFEALLSGFPKAKVIVVGGPEIYKVGSVLKKKEIPVILSPEIRTVMNWLGAERTNYVLKCQGLGLKMAFQPPGGIQEQIHLFDYLNRLALYGVKKDVLLKGVTLVPAEILGMEKVIGSLEKGKRADLIVFQSDPLEHIPVIQEVLSGGKRVK